MAENKQDISKFLHDIFATDDKEIHCSEASPLMVQSADAGLNLEASQARYPALWRHLKVCSDCAEEYEMLLALSSLEAAEQLEQPPHIPPLPDGGKPAVWKRAKDAITAVFPGFAPGLVAAVTRGQESMYPPVEVSLWDGRLFIEFDIAPHEADSQYRDLYVTMSSEEGAIAKLLDGITLWLQVGEEGAAVYNELLVEADAVFTRISPGTYTLRCELAGHEWVVTNIVLP